MTWKFDKHISEIYLDHVSKHLPDFYKVIDKTVECCINYSDQNSKILDFGCATGHTLEQLFYAGFTELYGVDSSQDMLDKCTAPATYLNGNMIPIMKFDVIIANWVIHFNKDKQELLQQIYSNLSPGGMFILSEKLIQSEFIKNRYYDWKLKQGATLKEIEEKEKALKNVMHLNKLDFYTETLSQLGFKNIEIINETWGFVTILAFK